jgi:flagellar hook assembly protein FlgD
VQVGDPSAIAGAAKPRSLIAAWPSPNPFAGTTEIRCYLPTSAQTTLRIYDLGGRLVRTCLAGWQGQGEWRVLWEGRDDAGRPVPEGVYLYRVVSGGKHNSGHLTLLR